MLLTEYRRIMPGIGIAADKEKTRRYMRQIILPEQLYRVLETEDGNPIQPQTAFRLKYHMRRQGNSQNRQNRQKQKKFPEISQFLFR